MNRTHLALFGIVAVAPAIGFALWSVIGWTLMFLGPCVYWGVVHQLAIQIAPNSMCSTVSESATQAIAGMLFVQGALISASIVGVLGLLRFNKYAMVASSILLFTESVLFVFDGLFVVILPSAIFLAFVVARVPRLS